MATNQINCQRPIHMKPQSFLCSLINIFQDTSISLWVTKPVYWEDSLLTPMTIRRRHADGHHFVGHWGFYFNIKKCWLNIKTEKKGGLGKKLREIIQILQLCLCNLGPAIDCTPLPVCSHMSLVRVYHWLTTCQSWVISQWVYSVFDSSVKSNPLSTCLLLTHKDTKKSQAKAS